MYQKLLFFSWIWITCNIQAQTLPENRRSDWHTAGRTSPIPSYSIVVNILDYGGSADSLQPNESAYQQALNALDGQAGVIFFPPGKYLFKHTIYLRDSLIIRGAGAEQTAFYFDLGSIQQNCIVARGHIVPDSNAVPLVKDLQVGDTLIYPAFPSFVSGQLLRCTYDDSLQLFSPWAWGLAGQIVEVQEANADHIRLNHPLRFEAGLALHPRLRKIEPLQDAGIECLKFTRIDPDVPIGSNIIFEHARRCWVTGVESQTCNFSHFTFDGAVQCEIYGCYAHDAFAYGGGGQGYGLVFQATASDNRAQNNIFRHLRHSMLVQSGANSNVLAYNYSSDPFWESVPSNAAGEIVIHGNLPAYNLFEGNVLGNIIPDGSHGDNGPMNTIFRNRATGYGLLVAGAEYQHQLNIIGNEITGTGVLQGLYLVGGEDNLEFGNIQNGMITPAGSPIAAETSLYFSTAPRFLSGIDYLIGPPATVNSARIPAETRFNSGVQKTDCNALDALSSVKPAPGQTPGGIQVFPNPASDKLIIQLPEDADVYIFNTNGRLFNTQHGVQQTTLMVDCSSWAPGMYYIWVKSSKKGIGIPVLILHE